MGKEPPEVRPLKQWRGQETLNHPLHRDAHGVYQLATMLMELDAEDETSSLLAADALYLLGRLDDARKSLLVTLSRRPQAAPVLVRLALLQLRRGFCYDANQVRRPRWAGAVGMAMDLQRTPRSLWLQVCSLQPRL